MQRMRCGACAMPHLRAKRKGVMAPLVSRAAKPTQLPSPSTLGKAGRLNSSANCSKLSSPAQACRHAVSEACCCQHVGVPYADDERGPKVSG